MPSVVIVDDHDNFRLAVKSVLASFTDFEIVGEAVCGEQALELVQKTKPDLVILDLSMPRRSGLSIIKDIKKLSSSTKILILTIHKEKEYVSTAFDSGADGFVLKDTGCAILRLAITAIMNGDNYVCPSIKEDLESN